MTLDEKLLVKIASEDKRTLQRAADAERLSLSAFIRRTVVQAAEQIINK